MRFGFDFVRATAAWLAFEIDDCMAGEHIHARRHNAAVYLTEYRFDALFHEAA